MACYGYIRVSTKGQVPGTSLAEQEQQIRERYPTATIVREAASGAHERQVFDNLCKSLQAGDTLVVCKMDRFCRSAKEGLQYVDLLRDKALPFTFSIWVCWITPLWGGLWQRCCLHLQNLNGRR